MPLDNTATIEDLVAAVNAIEDELGIEPMGVYADIRVRLDIIEARINNPLAPSPNTEDPFLIGNSGVTISTGNGEPTENRVDGSLYLMRDGYDTHGIYIRLGGLWREVMSAGGGVGSFGGDLAAITDSTQSVIGIRGKSVSATAPTDKQILSYNSSGLAWEPTTSKIQILNIPFEAVSSTALLTDDQANADLLIIIGGSDGDSEVEFPIGFTKPDGYSITIVNGTPVGYNITDPNGNITKLNAWGTWEGSWEVIEGFASHTYTPVIAYGTDSQIIRGNGSVSSTVPAVALPSPAASTKGGVALPASATGLFYKDDGSWASVSSSSSYIAPPTDGNTLLNWPLDEVFGSTSLNDTINGGANFALTKTLGTSFICGLKNNYFQIGSIEFNSARLATPSGVGTAGEIHPSGTTASISCWVNILSYSQTMIFYKTYKISGGTNGWSPPFLSFGLELNSVGSLLIDITRLGTLLNINTGFKPRLNRDYFLAATYDGSNVRAYVNGVLIFTYSAPGTIDWGTENAPWSCGADANDIITGGYLNGDIWMCRVDNTVRDGTYYLNQYKQAMGLP